MRYREDCSAPRKFYGFYIELYEATGDLKLFDQAYDLAVIGSGRRAITNRDFLKRLCSDFIETHKSEVQS
jgi:hypothetical protein